jgi:hypothetical protein
MEKHVGEKPWLRRRPDSRDLRHTREKLYEAEATITLDMPRRAWVEIEYRLVACKATDAAHTRIL